MEVTLGERGQITLPKSMREQLGLSKGTSLTVKMEHGKLILHKNVGEAINRIRGKFTLPDGMTTDDVMRELRGRAPGDPIEP